MLILNSTNQSPANDTDDLNDYSSNDEKWAGNHHYSSNLNGRNNRKYWLRKYIWLFLILQEWCHSHSDFQSGDDQELNITSSQGATFATFTPSTIERVNLCVFHVSIAFFGCALSVPILIYAKSNASAARFKLVNNFIVYICLVSLMLSVLQLGFGIR